MQSSGPFTFLNTDDAQPRLSRSFLKDQTTDVLRDHIVSGRIPPGTKLIEREVASQLGVSRAPVREALTELEKEGLIVSRPSGRYVIKLTQQDVRELYEVRFVLEKLAVELAVRNNTPENCALLDRTLQEMRDAVAQHDRAKHVEADVEMHWLVWRQAGNQHLLRMLSSMIGPVFMFVANNASAFNWEETLALHEEMVQSINAGDEAAAVAGIDRHLGNALQRSLNVFQDGTM
jgi:DNA-binding GntR family transcriptional regulator